MKLIILGCGTSTGVPVIGCRCEVCSSPDPRNRRTRASALIRAGAVNLLIDTSTDLRNQALSNGVNRVDAVLYTHPHADHIHGIDDLRSFNHLQGGPIPCFGNAHTVSRIREGFDYIFKDNSGDGWKPSLTTTVVDSPFDVLGVRVVPVEISHGKSSILGYRVGDIAYITDCSSIPAESVEKLKGVNVLVLGALRYRPHPTHFSIPEAIEAASAIRPRRTVLTHLSHTLDYSKDNRELPPGTELAYDGMVIEVQDSSKISSFGF